MPGPTNPQTWNRYAFVLNNPLRYVDPTGHLSIDEIKKWTDYNTQEELDVLQRDHSDIYGMLLAMHLGDWVYYASGSETEIGLGQAGLKDKRLTFGDTDNGMLEHMNASGFEVRRVMPGHKAGYNIPLVFQSGAFCGGCKGRRREANTMDPSESNYDPNREWVPYAKLVSDSTTQVNQVLEDAIGGAIGFGLGLACVECAVVVQGIIGVGSAAGWGLGTRAIRAGIPGAQNGDRTVTWQYEGGWTERLIIRDNQILRYELGR